MNEENITIIPNPESGTVQAAEPEVQKSMFEDFADAQSEFLPVRKNCINPAFKSHYADLGSILSSVRAALNRHGFAISWKIETTPEHVSAAVVLYHKSGESIESGAVTLPYYSAKGIPAQAIGSALTYARRYAISAFLGIATDDDDDGNAIGSPQPGTPAPAHEGYQLTKQDTDRLDLVARQGSKAYAEAWGKLPREVRSALVKSGWHEELKARASAVDEANKEGSND